jgi:hypothetical protein
MFGLVKRKAARVGLKSVKVVVTLEIDSLVVVNQTSDANLAPGSLLSVSFERGSKGVATEDRPLKFEDVDANPLRGVSNSGLAVGGKVAHLPGRLELVATLYHDPDTGVYQPKEAMVKLRVLQKKKAFQRETHKTLASHTLKLHELMAGVVLEQPHTFQQGLQKEMQLSLEGLPTGSVLRVMVSLLPLHVGDGDVDDTESVSSLISDNLSDTSESAFDYDDLIDSQSGNKSVSATNRRLSTTVGARMESLNYQENVALSSAEDQQQPHGSESLSTNHASEGLPPAESPDGIRKSASQVVENSRKQRSQSLLMQRAPIHSRTANPSTSLQAMHAANARLLEKERERNAVVAATRASLLPGKDDVVPTEGIHQVSRRCRRLFFIAAYNIFLVFLPMIVSEQIREQPRRSGLDSSDAQDGYTQCFDWLLSRPGNNAMPSIVSKQKKKPYPRYQLNN